MPSRFPIITIVIIVYLPRARVVFGIGRTVLELEKSKKKNNKETLRNYQKKKKKLAFLATIEHNLNPLIPLVERNN